MMPRSVIMGPRSVPAPPDMPASPYANCHIAVISNRNSGHNRDHFADIERLLTGSDRLSHHVTESAAQTPALLAQLADQNTGVIAINGGDGTAAQLFGQILEGGLFKTPPLLILLPGGTANMTAGDIGVTGKLPAAVQRLCDWNQAGRPIADNIVERQVLALDIPGEANTHYGMFAGSGAIILATDYAHAEVHSRGLRDDFSLGLTLIRTIWGMVRNDPKFAKPSPISVALDGGEFQEYQTLILATSTLERLFLGIHPFWGEGQGALKLSLIENGADRFLRTFLAILSGRKSRYAQPSAGYHGHRVNSLKLLMDGKINLDGELLEVSREQGPASLRTTGPLRFLRL